MPSKTPAAAGKPPADQTAALAPMDFKPNVGIELKTYDDLWRFANMVVRAGWAPKGMDKPESIMAAVQYGQELGITPMAAIQRIAVINGRPMIWGDMMLALCRAAGCWDESGFGEAESQTTQGALCSVRRKGGASITRSFTIDDAKKAGLWGKQGPWTQYPKRMLQMRARSFALRDAFPDVLMGLYSREEMVGAKDYGDVFVDAHSQPTTLSSAELEASLSKGAGGASTSGSGTIKLPPATVYDPPEAPQSPPPAAAGSKEPEEANVPPTKEDLVALRVEIKNGYQKLDTAQRKKFKALVEIQLIGDVENITSIDHLESMVEALAA